MRKRKDQKGDLMCWGRGQNREQEVQGKKIKNEGKSSLRHERRNYPTRRAR